MKEIWIVKSSVSDTEAWYESVGYYPAEGDTEWQFSDGPPGKRGSSADYLNLEEGLRSHSPAIFHFVE